MKQDRKKRYNALIIGQVLYVDCMLDNKRHMFSVYSSGQVCKTVVEYENSGSEREMEYLLENYDNRSFTYSVTKRNLVAPLFR